jgi:predicted helicase
VDWEEAVKKFSEKIPDLAGGVTDILAAEHRNNPEFRERFQAFAEPCRSSINPDLADDAIRKMLVQHLLTERIFRKVFNNNEFLSRNVIAAEIEKVIQAITHRHFSRDEFLKPLDRFYTAIERAAEQQTGYTEKQHFLNAVYEKFFQSFDRKQADTHGIVYTPQPIVDFMVRSVEEVLQSEFGKSLSDEGVHILDPFTGTGNFITRIMQQIKRSRLPQKYAEELHCNEVMLLPYYIASMNIEHAYMEKMGEYRPFEGICLVDTFELAEPQTMQLEFMNEGNSERVRRQKKAPIRVVIGNPPYNMGQVSENDQNKNRKYRHMDKRVQETYTKDSKATLRNKLSDPYVKAFRLASDRIRATGGVVAFVTNNSFIDQIAFDGMRKHLARDFTGVYHVNLKGNARTSGLRRRREAGNVFDDLIRVGIGITLLVKNIETKKRSIHIYSIDDFLNAREKKALLDSWGSMSNVPLQETIPDAQNTWITEGQQDDYHTLLALGDKVSKGDAATEAVFRLFSLGVATNRDEWVYSYDQQGLRTNVGQIDVVVGREAARYQKLSKEERERYQPAIDSQDIKWTDRLIDAVQRNPSLDFMESKVRRAIYRPFDSRYLYFDHLLNQRRYQQHRFFPKADSFNQCVCLNATPGSSEFYCMASSRVPDLHFTGDSQCFPFYTYAEDGSNPQENITDWALDLYRTHYSDASITKWDIFHSTYALLHHPEYRSRYAANLKRELPRIPFPPDLAAFAEAGKRLMELHIDYEQQPEYPLDEVENPKAPWTLRVERMRLSKDKTELRYNEALTLRGIPPAVYDYRLGNRSGLEWVIDQYRVSTDARSGITNDPNRVDDERYILRLIGQVITVSLETQKIIAALPGMNFPGPLSGADADAPAEAESD